MKTKLAVLILALVALMACKDKDKKKKAKSEVSTSNLTKGQNQKGISLDVFLDLIDSTVHEGKATREDLLRRLWLQKESMTTLDPKAKLGTCIIADTHASIGAKPPQGYTASTKGYAMVSIEAVDFEGCKNHGVQTVGVTKPSNSIISFLANTKLEHEKDNP